MAHRHADDGGERGSASLDLGHRGAISLPDEPLIKKARRDEAPAMARFHNRPRKKKSHLLSAAEARAPLSLVPRGVVGKVCTEAPPRALVLESRKNSHPEEAAQEEKAKLKVTSPSPAPPVNGVPARAPSLNRPMNTYGREPGAPKISERKRTAPRARRAREMPLAFFAFQEAHHHLPPTLRENSEWSLRHGPGKATGESAAPCGLFGRGE